MKHTKKIFLFTVVFLAMYSCSTKKDTIVNRNYHALTTYFNILFNGEEVFKDGIESINKGFKDDWFEQLPIEPIVFDERKIAAPKFNNSGPGGGFGLKKRIQLQVTNQKNKLLLKKQKKKL